MYRDLTSSTTVHRRGGDGFESHSKPRHNDFNVPADAMSGQTLIVKVR